MRGSAIFKAEQLLSLLSSQLLMCTFSLVLLFPHSPVVWISLLVQNTLVCACSVALAVLFGLNLDLCSDVPLYLFGILTAIVIVLGASANLATVVNTIAVEKDWVVVIADKNKDILASEQYYIISPQSCYQSSLGAIYS